MSGYEDRTVPSPELHLWRITSADGERLWHATDAEHALEQHRDAFPDDEIEGSPEPAYLVNQDYEQARERYWEAQRVFREAAIREMQRLLRLAGVQKVALDVRSELGEHRLEVVGLGGVPDSLSEEAEYELMDTLDAIAENMEIVSWDEAKSVLFRDESGLLFEVIA